MRSQNVAAVRPHAIVCRMIPPRSIDIGELDGDAPFDDENAHHVLTHLSLLFQRLNTFICTGCQNKATLLVPAFSPLLFIIHFFSSSFFFFFPRPQVITSNKAVHSYGQLQSAVLKTKPGSKAYADGLIVGNIHDMSSKQSKPDSLNRTGSFWTSHTKATTCTILHEQPSSEVLANQV